MATSSAPGRDYILDDDVSRAAWFFKNTVAMFVIFSVFYVVSLTRLSLSIDDEHAAFRVDSGVWILQGRWTSYLVESFLMPRPVMPFAVVALFGLAMAAGYTIVLRSLRPAIGLAPAYFAFPLLVAFPTWSLLLAFQSNTPPQALAIVLACVGLALIVPLLRPDARAFERRALMRLALAAVLGATVIGAYQANLMLLGCLGIAAILLLAVADEKWSTRTILRAVGVVAIWLVLSLALYYVILKSLQWSFSVTSSAYLDSFMNVDSVLARPVRVLLRTLAEMRRVYTGKVFGAGSIVFTGVVVAGFVALAVTPRLRGRPGPRALLMLLLAAALALPFAQNPLVNGAMPYRALVGAPVAFWLCGILVLTVPLRWVARAGLAVVVAASIQALLVINTLQASAILLDKRDTATAAAVYEAVARANPGFDRSVPHPVAVYGAWPFATVYKRTDTSTMGASFFEWDGGNPYRVVTYMTLLGYDGLVVAPPAAIETLRAVAKDMPVWPAEGSVRHVDGVTIVKMGPI